jgi:hypothetical protein
MLLSKVKEYKKIIIAVFVALVVGVAAGRYATPEKVIKEKEFVIKEVEIEKIVKVMVKEEQKKTETKKSKTTKKVTNPDGTVTEETKETEEDLTFIDRSEKEKESKETSSEKSISGNSKKETKFNTKKVSVSVLAGIKSGPEWYSYPETVFGAHIKYNFLGPVSVGAFGTTSNEFGLSVGIDF